MARATHMPRAYRRLSDADKRLHRARWAQEGHGNDDSNGEGVDDEERWSVDSDHSSRHQRKKKRARNRRRGQHHQKNGTGDNGVGEAPSSSSSESSSSDSKSDQEGNLFDNATLRSGRRRTKQKQRGLRHSKKNRHGCGELYLDGRLDLNVAHDHVVWLGDLNYRLDVPSHWRFVYRFAHAVELALRRDWAALWDFDELRTAVVLGRCLPNFRMCRPTFPPTYRIRRRRDGRGHAVSSAASSTSFSAPPFSLSSPAPPWSFDDSTMPCWANRVLWRSAPGLEDRIVPHEYWPGARFATSDRKPICARLSLRLEEGAVLTRVRERRVVLAGTPSRGDANGGWGG